MKLRAVLLLLTLPFVCLAVEESVEPGVKEVPRPITDLTPAAVIELGGKPDWMVVTDNAVWVSNSPAHRVHRIDPATNKEIARIECPGEPDSGIAAGFGHIWVPVVGTPSVLLGIDEHTNHIDRTFSIGPADAEGGIAASADSLWMTAVKDGPLLRIDPVTGEIRQRIALPAGSYNPVCIGDKIWITSGAENLVSCIDARIGALRGQVPTGPKPRFSTCDGKFLWVLNQGDGSVTKIDVAARKAVATIAAGVPGHGGEISVGGGAVWVTVMDIPLSKIDSASDRVVSQWKGRGGDAVRYGFGSVWLTDLRHGQLWRFQPAP